MDQAKGQRNLVMLCDNQGLIKGIINDEVKISERKCIGKDFTCIFNDESHGKALNFLEMVRKKKVVLNYEMPVKSEEGEVLLSFAGTTIDKKVIVIATDNFFVINDLFEGMTEIINEQTNIIRACNEEKARAAKIGRERIERDLHDSISQTIFSTSVIAEILPQLWKKDQEEALKQVEKIKMLTKESLSALRRLLLELRPDFFEDEDINELLLQLTNSAKLRTDIEIRLNVIGSGNPSKEVKEAIYRISQEALNNAIKHSGASILNIILKYLPGRIHLIIEDNGHGFEMGIVPKNKYGLYIMHERSKSIDSDLKITSSKEKGTKIVFKCRV
jgi:signal transduction histidine kinase